MVGSFIIIYGTVKGKTRLWFSIRIIITFWNTTVFMLGTQPSWSLKNHSLSIFISFPGISDRNWQSKLNSTDIFKCLIIYFLFHLWGAMWKQFWTFSTLCRTDISFYCSYVDIIIWWYDYDDYKVKICALFHFNVEQPMKKILR